uniref:Uncharacterized protein n=1 Tax=Rhizophora mucronata TaxID=61149 RepID=A0A2P2N3G9_RHIMU
MTTFTIPHFKPFVYTCLSKSSFNLQALSTEFSMYCSTGFTCKIACY